MDDNVVTGARVDVEIVVALAEAGSGRAAEIVEQRLTQLHRHLTRTIAAMAAPV